MPSPKIYRKWARDYLARAAEASERDQKLKYLSLAVQNCIRAQKGEAEEARAAELHKSVVKDAAAPPELNGRHAANGTSRAGSIAHLNGKDVRVPNAQRSGTAPVGWSDLDQREDIVLIRMRLARGRSHLAMLDEHITRARNRGSATAIVENLRPTFEMSVRLMQDCLHRARRSAAPA